MSLKLKRGDSPVETMDKDQLANLATMPGYIGLACAFLLSFIAQKFGRKICLIVIGVFTCIGGVALTLASNKYYLYAGRILTSMVGGAVSLAPMFISEIVHESLRGTLIAMCTLLLNVGILVSYTAGAKLSYKLYNSLFIILPAAYTICLFFLPETPLFLADKSRLEEAKKSMTWYRGGDRHIAELELGRLQPLKKEGEQSLSFREILKRKVTRLAMFISVLLYMFQALSGIFQILNYAGIIFEESGSTMEPEDSAIVIASILLGSAVVNMLLMDRLGRKPLMYISFVGSAISMTGLAIFLYVRMKGAEVEHLGWIPISSLSLFVFTYGVGLATVPGALTNELTPTSMKPAIGAVAMVFAFSIMMTTLQAFPYMDDNLGLYSVFVIPSIANIVGVFFTFLMVPETKGKSLSEIEEELKNR